MEIAVDVKEENNITTKTVLPIEDMNEQTLVSPTTEINVSTAANDLPALDCTDSNDNEPKTKLMSVVDVNSSSKSVSIEANEPVSVSVEASNSVSIKSSDSLITEHNLNVAMASITISDTVEVKQNSNEDILDEQLKQNTITTENENSVVQKSTNSIHENDKNILGTDELNSTAGGDYEDTRDYTDDEYYTYAKQTDNENDRSFITAVDNEEDWGAKQTDNENERSFISAVANDENCGEKQTDNENERSFISAVDNEEDWGAKQTDNENERSFISAVDNEENWAEEEQVDNEDEQAASSSEMPVPVDDDTNDPQYIPRRGRFYEHDDRMAYSTTSSEDCESSEVYDDTSDEDDDNSLRRRNRKLHIDNKKHKPTDATEDIAVQNIEPQATSTINTIKVLNISKVAAEAKNSFDTPITSHVNVSVKKSGGRKSRNIDLLDKWGHDLYDEREQTRKSRDELLSSYGYDIREEIEAPRARRHHKYGRTATVKYNRSWQDTKAYTGANSEKRSGLGRRNIGSQYNKNKPKSSTPAEEYNWDFPTLDHAKSSTEVPKKVIAQERSQVNKNSDMAAGSSKNSTHITRTSTKYSNSPQYRNNREPQNREFLPQSPNKNVFNRNNYNSKERDSTPVARDFPSTADNSNFFNRKLSQHSGGPSQPHSFKQHYNNTHVSHGQNQSQSSIRSHDFQQHNNSPQFNRDRYFSKGITTQSPNLHHTTVGSGRIQHSEEHYHHYNNQQYENEVQKVEPQLAPVVRSSKRYSVQSRRELPDPVLNFGGMSKVTQQQSQVSQHQQNNSLIMQEPPPQMQQPPPQMQQPPPQMQQPPPQMQQPPPQMQQIQLQQPPMQLQQFHQPMPQINSHHSMVVDPNTGMVLMATDPSMYHQLYAPPQYGTTVAQGSPGNSAEDQNAAAVAAAALQMLAAQAAVYQPLPTGPTPVTSPPTGTQPIQQPPDSFMTTYYQPQPPTQPPPRRVNLAIPIVAPSELNQQQHVSKSNPTQTPPPTAASTN